MTNEFWVGFGYLMFVALGVLLAAIGRFRPSVLLPLNELVSFISSHRITRIALFVVWWWLGWHFLAGVTVN